MPIKQRERRKARTFWCAAVTSLISLGLIPVDGQQGNVSQSDQATAVFVLDVVGDGLQLTNVADGVAFDFDAIGKRIRTAWTSSASDDGFLVIDVNKNGRVDSGSEMLGNGWKAADGQRVSALESLMLIQGFPVSAINRPTSESPGISWINREDKVFPELRFWRDRNHNGESEADELLTLPDAGISTVYLTFLKNKDGRPTMDTFGNGVVMEGVFRLGDGGRAFERNMQLVRFAR